MATKLKNWSEYLDAMKGAGDLIERTWRPDDEHYRGDLFRQLMMNISYAYFQYFQSNEVNPDFMPLWNSVFTLQPNPDDVYLWAPLQGDLRYRVTGDRGTIHYVSILLGGKMIGMHDEPMGGKYQLNLDETMVDENGKVDILFSVERPDGYTGTWQQIDPEVDYMIVRQRSYDWGNEIDSRFAIECLDGPDLKRQMDVAEIADRLDKLVKVPERWSALWIDWQNDRLENLGQNTFELNTFSEMSGAHNQYYWQAIFDLSPGEALILETDLPEKRPYWNVQMNDPIFNAIEYVYRQSSLNGHTARVDSDGKFRAVVCREDPGVPNWLDTAGYLQGTIIGRWTACDSAPVPTLTRVPFGDIRQHLPADTPVVTAEQRSATLRKRRLGAQMRRRW
jgi:hypothetical protein